MTSSRRYPHVNRQPSRVGGWLAAIMDILLAGCFIVSAAAKLWSIDQFEMYVYSYGLFSLNLTFILVRLCIGVELALGIMLLIGWRRRTVLLAMLAMLLFFSLFLCYAALRGRTDSCQCFGQLADMPPAVSLLKNAVLTLLTLVALRLQREQKWLGVVVSVVGLAVPFIVSVPDSWMFGASHERYNSAALKEVVSGKWKVESESAASGHPSPSSSHLSPRLLAFVTPGCPYCQMTRQKLDAMAERNQLADGAIVYIEPKDIGDSLFLAITYGARPLLLLMDGDSVTATYHYRNINERQIVKKMKNEKGEMRNGK